MTRKVADHKMKEFGAVELSLLYELGLIFMSVSTI